MSVNSINNNAAQLYTQQKPATATLQQQNNQAAVTTLAPAVDSVQISEQARALYTSAIPGNGAGIEPPKTGPKNTPVYGTLGNGAGIEPPKTGYTTAPSYNTLGNGAGIEPPKQ